MSRDETDLLEGAADDTREAYLSYLEKSRRVAAVFQVQLDEAILDLKENAHRYEMIKDPIRHCPMKQFPHGLMHESDGERVA